MNSSGHPPPAASTAHIRPAGPDDWPVLWAILEPVFRAGDTYAVDPDISEDEARAYWFRPGNAVSVAEIDGRACGTYYMRPNQPGGGSHVANCGFVTGTAARGKGLARAMLEHALEAAPGAGFRAIQFNFVISTNAGAIRIWQDYGFAVVGRLPDAFRHPKDGFVDVLVMYKSLV